MDDLTLIREFFDEPAAPTRHVTAAARSRALGTGGTTRTTVRTGRWRWRWTTGGLGLAAASLAAIVAIIMVGEGAPGSPHPVTPQPPTASEILLAAATTAETTPAVTGTYWHIKQIYYSDYTGRRGKEDYRFFEGWYRPDGQSWTREGTPQAPGAIHKVPKSQMGHNFLQLGVKPVSYAGLQKLPIDPDALKALVVKGIKGSEDGSPMPADLLELSVGTTLSLLLLGTPAPPKVRAAAFRALASLPSVRSLGAVRDSRGRTGQGLQIAGTHGKYWDDNELIIDPKSSLVLSQTVRSGTAGGSEPDFRGLTLILEVGWTDSKP
jgi:hypothetical protein